MRRTSAGRPIGLVEALDTRLSIGTYRGLTLAEVLLGLPDGADYIKFLGRRAPGRDGDVASILTEHLCLEST